MRRNSLWKLWTCTGGIVLGGLAAAQQAEAQTVTGDLTTTTVNYGANVPGSGALAVQTVDSLFGSSQLDAAYGVVENNSLYLFIAGNLQNNGNILQIWIDAVPGGQNTLANIPTTAGSMNVEDGSIFSPGFNASYALEFNVNKATEGGVAGTYGFVDAFNLTGTPTASFLGYFPTNGTVGSSQSGGDLTAMQAAYDNLNTTLGIPNGSATSGALLPSNATPLQVTTGVELGIPLSLLGNPTSNIEVLAGLNGGSDSGLSNQLLPGLPASTAVNIGGTLGQPDIKTSTSAYYVAGHTKEFNLSSTSDQFFTVPVTSVANGIWNPNGGTSSGSWANAANWSNSYIPQQPGDLASFGSALSAATVALNGNYSVGTISFNSANSFTITPGTGGTLTLANGSNTAEVVNSAGQHTITAPVVLSSNALFNAQSHGAVIDVTGNISGTGQLTTSAATNSAGGGAAYSAVILSGSNTYTGPTVIQTGVLQLGSPTALPAGTSLSLLSAQNSALDLNGFNASVSSLSGAGPGVSGGIINSNTTAGTAVFTYAGTISNPSVYTGNITDSFNTGGNVTELSILSGSLTLTGTNTYAGGSTIAPGGMLQIASSDGNGEALPTLGLVTNNGSLIINDNLLGGAITGSGVTTFGNGFSSQIASFSQTGGLVDNGQAEILGPAVSGPISGSGLLIIDDSLQLVGGASQIQSLQLSGGAVLDLNGNSLTVSSFSGGGGGATIGNSSTNTAATLIYAGGSDNLSADIQDGLNGSGKSVALSVVSGQLSLSGSNTFTGGASIAGGASLQISAAGALPAGETVVNNGTFDVEAASVAGNISGSGALIVGSNSVLQLQKSSGPGTIASLTVNSGSSLDLTNNPLIINYGTGTDPIATIQQYLSDGYAAGWAGGEIMSSSVAALNGGNGLKYAVGYIDGASPPANFNSPIDSGTIEVMPTLAGDATLQGTVDFYDFQVVLANFGKSGENWDQGDFDYATAVDFNDFQLVLSNFGANLNALSSSQLAELNNFAGQSGYGVVETNHGLSLVSVPEPASVGLLAAAGIGLMARRRRNADR